MGEYKNKHGVKNGGREYNDLGGGEAMTSNLTVRGSARSLATHSGAYWTLALGGGR